MAFISNNIKSILMITLALTLVACGSTEKEVVEPTVEPVQEQPTIETQQPVEEISTPEASPIAEQTLSARELLEQADSPLASRIIYFEYDSARINDDSLALLEAHGIFIAENSNVSVRLEGHTDERGSREYNIALGDRRAQSVRRLLLFQGASSDQIETVSYGEEIPAVVAHSEEAWQQNRRVELVYQVR